MKIAPLFSEKEVLAQVHKMACSIRRFYGSKEVLAVGVLTGAFVFYTDLLRQLKMPQVLCDFCAVSFYKGGVKALNEPVLVLDIKTPVRGKHVLLVDCIADNGLSFDFLKNHIQKRSPADLKTAALVTKPQALKKSMPDWKGFQVAQDVFVVGYGVDYRHEGRALSGLHQVSDIN